MGHTPSGSCNSGKLCQRMTAMTEVTGEIFRTSERMPRMSQQRRATSYIIHNHRGLPNRAEGNSKQRCKIRQQTISFAERALSQKIKIRAFTLTRTYNFNSSLLHFSRQCSRFGDWLRAGSSGVRIPVGTRDFLNTRPDRPWGHPSLMYNRYTVCSANKAAGTRI